ncbi:katanin p80 WD40 repeat-containing subunit B1 [Anopheles nili]|uniref:katanin p80 WD40 repeat-containing subunit B1 n=1 Tax=Anopheles nili TaxID=185578 RepID=UPI00237B55A1|nr:katanin p80 WD40 repeat-containing subunit B1 [Anopheles nili]
MASLSWKLPAKMYGIQAHSSIVTCLDIGETGRVLVTGGQDRSIKLWTFGDEKCFMTLSGHNSSIDCVRFAYKDDFVYSSDDTGVIKRWNLNVSDSISLYGHMKSVRSLDTHPYSDFYVVSGSNDTTIRLWDVRQKSSIKQYRGHMAHVNSVKFSPDACWIASAGTEGSVIIWDIRMSKPFMEFNEQMKPATCVKYHPTDLLMAAGRKDGSVELYDLEKREMITQIPPATNTASRTGVHPVESLTFDDSGKCLFVGTTGAITVIGWEPDREFDRIDAYWSQLGDMKIVGSKLLIGTYDETSVAIHAVQLGHLRAFYNPQNQPQLFTHNQTSRKSFSRGSGKVRLSIGTGSGAGSGAGGAALSSNGGPDAADGTGNGGGMSPNLNIEMIDEEDANCGGAFDFVVPLAKSSHDDLGNGGSAPVRFPVGPGENTRSPSLSPTFIEKHNLKLETKHLPNLLPMILRKDVGKEDFPVNNAQPPDYAPKGAGPPTSGRSGMAFVNGTSSGSVSNTGKAAETGTSRRSANLRSNSGAGTEQRRPGSIHGGVGHSRSAGNLVRRLATSKSTLELNKVRLDETYIIEEPISRGSSPIRPQITSLRNGSGSSSDRQRQHNSNVKVQIVTKPVRSKTSLDIRHHAQRSATAMVAPAPGTYRHQITSFDQPVVAGLHGDVLSEIGGAGINVGALLLDRPAGPTNIRNGGHESSSMEYGIQVLRNEHDATLQALCNRTALLSAIRNYTKTGDVAGALKVAVRMNDQHILVDLLGAILEKTSQWTLDMCVLLLPKVYDLLQSEYKFHFTRACDTLRVILSTFLPVIRENTDPWGSRSIGVDVSREERQRKCMECKNWLLRIRCLPENPKMGTNLQQLQNMIVDI